jgi:tRNA ligase
MASASMLDNITLVGELPETGWEYCSKNLQGPFQATLKENGCIVFAACVNDALLVTSKHAFGPSPTPLKLSHADKAKKWLLVHLANKNVQESELVAFLKNNNVTAVFEVYSNS